MGHAWASRGRVTRVSAPFRGRVQLLWTFPDICLHVRVAAVIEILRHMHVAANPLPWGLLLTVAASQVHTTRSPFILFSRCRSRRKFGRNVHAPARTAGWSVASSRGIDQGRRSNLVLD
jgi:hypothetical protein